MGIEKANKGNPEVGSISTLHVKIGNFSHFISIFRGSTKDDIIITNRQVYLENMMLRTMSNYFVLNLYWHAPTKDTTSYVRVKDSLASGTPLKRNNSYGTQVIDKNIGLVV
jgi:hypothetical protein